MRVSWVIGGILLLTRAAFALNPRSDIDQYGHTAWTLRDGTFEGRVKALAQTTDGYLWVGTESGLYRFNGARFVPWRAPNDKLPSPNILKLLAGRDGSLWIGTPVGLARWHGGRLTTYLANQSVVALLEDHSGTVWIGTHGGTQGAGKLCALVREQLRCESGNEALGRFVISLHETPDGQLWVGAATGLWQWKPTPRSYPLPLRFPEIQSIVDDGEHLLLTINREVQQLSGGVLTPYPVPGLPDNLKPTVLYRDRDTAMWIGTQDRGLIRVHGGRTARFAQANGLSGDFVVGIIEDREGDLWVATLNGVDRLVDRASITFSTQQGLSTGTVTSIVPAADGAIWIGTVGGLNRWDSGGLGPAGPTTLRAASIASLLVDSRDRLWVSTPNGIGYVSGNRLVRVPGIQEGFFRAMVQDVDGNIWVSDQERGLRRLRDGTLVATVPWAQLGGRLARVLAADPNGGIWIGFVDGGVAHYGGNRLDRSYGKEGGLAAGEVTDLRFDRSGALWVATPRGVSRIKDGRIRTADSSTGLPCDGTLWSLQDESGAIWLRMQCGLVRIAAAELDAWLVDPSRRLVTHNLDSSDGVAGAVSVSAYSPTAARALDGRIWFRSFDGVSVVDPKYLRLNQVPPPVHVEEITVDRKAMAPEPETVLPAGMQDLRIDYTALSLVVPERVRFRYKLEGRDSDWIDAGERRQAFYTDLPPRAYRFRVIAANNSGVWNTAGAAWDFSVEPAFYQTIAFRMATGLTIVMLVASAYWFRFRRLAALMDLRFKERLAERNRIAQGLHDTLLQGLVSVSMQLHVLNDEIADHPGHSKLQHILGRVTQVIDEGRRTVNELQVESSDDLEAALTTDAERLRGLQRTTVKVVVNGQKLPLVQTVRDAVYRIAREALANAFQHAHASRVELQIDYTSSDLVVYIRDNGVGMEATLIESGRRPGHWGLPGMKQRAEEIGASFHVRSRQSTGTEVEIAVPARRAFATQGAAASVDTLPT